MSEQLPQRRSRVQIVLGSAELTFNFSAALPGRASSIHTQRAYFRWVDHYLSTIAALKPSRGQERVQRMQMLPVALLQESLSTQQLRAWLGVLAREGHGKQGLDQARASIVTLTDLFAEAGWFDEQEAAAMARVRAPRAEDGQRPGRWLSLDQIRVLMAAGKEIATSPTQSLRNSVVLTMLCTMALRREELSIARWGDLSIQNDRPVLRVHGKGRRVATVDIPRPVIRALDGWRRLVAASDAPPVPESRIVRRIWKGGGVSKGGLSADGIWLIVDRSAKYAELGHVAPHDLRRSVAGALNEAGTPIDKISRLLRHSNVAVTERYLNRLPQANEGALLMSSLLSLEDDDMADWPGFE
ncbi:MAG: site-specific integrase [bacterium]|nr:site-specific integrase [bacterium]